MLKTFGVLALVFVGLVFSASAASAYRGDYSVKGPDCDSERHEAMEAAFESSDYNAWYALMTEDGRHPRVVDLVNEENFATFVAAHEAGDYETAAKMRQELGLNNGNGPRDGTGHGKGFGKQGNQGGCQGEEECERNGKGQHKGRGKGKWRS